MFLAMLYLHHQCYAFFGNAKLGLKLIMQRCGEAGGNFGELGMSIILNHKLK